MTTSGLSAEAKEFVPFVQIPPPLLPLPPSTIPFYINENPFGSIYPPEQPILYPLLKIPDIEFHIPPHANNPNVSPIVYVPNYPPTTYYPIDYSKQTITNYSNSNRKQHPNNRTNNRQSRNNTHTDAKQQQQQQRENKDKFSFKLRTEDFPTLPINNQQSVTIPTQPSISTETKTTPSWSTIVSTPSRPQSTSPSRSRPRSDRSLSSNKKVLEEKNIKSIVIPEQQRSQSVTSNDTSVNEKKKRPKRKKNKNKQTGEEKPSIPESITFSLDDENAFPALGLDVPTSEPKKAETTKDNNVSTPGIIKKAKIKANHAFQIRLADMFNALSTSTQPKQQNPSTKPNKSSSQIINSANPLDSNPVPKRGKEREQPKPRKPTKLKRIINKELEENQKQRQQSLAKIPTIKQTDDKDAQNDVINDCMNNLHINITESTSTSCSEESQNETDDDDDDDDDDENLDHEPTSQLQTPYAQQTASQSNIKQQIHDAGFREYCSQLIDRQLDELCIQLLLTLKRFQDRKKQQYQNNPERVRTKRRFVHGIREVTKHLRVQRLKCVLIAPDCQSIQSQGGLNDALESIINLCKEQNIPYIFTLNRQKLGRCLNKISRVSTIGIFDYSGVDQIYKKIIEITNENQRAYKQIIDNILNHDDTFPSTATTTPSHGLNSKEFYRILHRTFQQQQQQQQQPKHHIVNTIPHESLSKVLPRVPAHYGHSRQTSDTSTIFIDPQLINSIKKQHTRASSGTYDMGTKKNHQRTLSDGGTITTMDDNITISTKHHSLKTHSRTPSGCSAISQIEQQDYFEQSKNILMNNNNNTNDDGSMDMNDENRLKAINEDTEDNTAYIKRKNVEKWINDN